MSVPSSDTIPLVDLRALHAPIRAELDAAIAEVVDSAAFIKGPVLADFEERFASYCGAAFAAGCSSATSALHLLFLAHEIGPGDEVIVPSHTFFATAESVCLAGATPVFGEIDRRTMCMHPIAAEAMVTPRTRAICVVHLYGRMADMRGFRELCDRYGLLFIEDAAQAHGARPTTENQGRGMQSEDRRAGALADGAAFSFFPGKNLGAMGDAGIVTTNDGEIADRVRRMSDHGRASKYEHGAIGFNYRMDPIQAAILRVKLAHLDRWNEQRRAAAGRYDSLLGDVEEIALPSLDAGEGHVWHLYVVRTARRDELAAHLQRRGIATGVHYPVPCHLQPALKGHFQALPGLLQETEAAAAEVLSLPLFPGISEDQQTRVAEAVRESFA